MFSLAEKYILKSIQWRLPTTFQGHQTDPQTPSGINNFGRIPVKIIDSCRIGNVQRLPLARSLYV